MKFVEKVSKILDRMGWTQQKLEESAHLPPARYSKWKHGTGEPTISQAFLMAQSLGMSLDELADESRGIPAVERQVDPIVEAQQRNVAILAEEIGLIDAAKILEAVRFMGPDEAMGRLMKIEERMGVREIPPKFDKEVTAGGQRPGRYPKKKRGG